MIILLKTPDPDNPYDIGEVMMSIEHNDIGVNELLELFDRFAKALSFAYDGEIGIVEET